MRLRSGSILFSVHSYVYTVVGGIFFFFRRSVFLFLLWVVTVFGSVS